MTKSIKALLLLSGAALLMSACGNDPKAANEANFEKALNAHYVQMKQCVRDRQCAQCRWHHSRI